MPRLLLACSVAILIVGTLLVPRPSAAQDHRLWVGLDLDLDDSTGCSIDGEDSSGDQTATGFEWKVELVVTPSTPTAAVEKVESLRCDDAETRLDLVAWESHGEDTDTPWSVGIGNGEDPGTGEGPGDVVEFEIDTTDLGIGEQVRIVVFSESAEGHGDTLLTVDGTSGGASILFPNVVSVPALSAGVLAILVFLLFVSALLGVRRWPATLALWVAVFGLAAERGIASITLVLDGGVIDWAGVSVLASDPAEDSASNDPAGDILALFVDWSGTNLAFRIDVADLSVEMCADPDSCTYFSTDSTETLSATLSGLADGARLVIEPGDYELVGTTTIGGSGVHILAEDGVTIHNTIAEFQETGEANWFDAGGGIYHSENPYEIDSESLSNHDRAWGRFYVVVEAFMLMPYACYEALSSTNYFDTTDDEDYSGDCEEKPYVGPGIYWDKEGSVGSDSELGFELEPGHIFIRMDTSPEPLNSLVAESDFSIDPNPNNSVIEITIDGPRLQLGGDDILVSNLTMVLGSIRIGGESEGGELRDVVLDGPTYDAPIEIYTGASDYLFDGLTIEQNFPPWFTWVDTKNIFFDTIRYSAISLNGRDADDIDDGIEAIHDITLRNSTIQNVHDGLELISDDYHHLYIADNTFLNVQDDAIQLGSQSYEIEIADNTFEEVGTSVSRHGTSQDGEENPFPGYKYIHHNYIDASTPKYYCREVSAGNFGDGSTCDENGMLTLRAFQVHLGDGWGPDGDTRYIYNNTVIVDGQMIGIGFQGQEYASYCVDGGFGDNPEEKVDCDFTVAGDCDGKCVDAPETGCDNDGDCGSSGQCSSGATCQNYELPYHQPSLVFNNVFVQLDNVTSSFVESPQWSILAPPVLITGGNLYYQPPPDDACAGDDFTDALGDNYPCDPLTDNSCRICIEGDSSMLEFSCETNPECSPSGSGSGRCSASAVCQMTDRVFKMSGTVCGLTDFQIHHCKGDPNWTPQIAPPWNSEYKAGFDENYTEVEFSWDLEEGGLQDSSELELDTYVPACDTEDTIAPIDLTAIDRDYTVSAGGSEIWELSLKEPLPGVESGVSYRGATPCPDSSD